MFDTIINCTPRKFYVNLLIVLYIFIIKKKNQYQYCVTALSNTLFITITKNEFFSIRFCLFINCFILNKTFCIVFIKFLIFLILLLCFLGAFFVCICCSCLFVCLFVVVFCFLVGRRIVWFNLLPEVGLVIVSQNIQINSVN